MSYLFNIYGPNQVFFFKHEHNYIGKVVFCSNVFLYLDFCLWLLKTQIEIFTTCSYSNPIKKSMTRAKPSLYTKILHDKTGR